MVTRICQLNARSLCFGRVLTAALLFHTGWFGTSARCAVVALPLCPGDQASSIYSLTVDGETIPVGAPTFNGQKNFHVAAFETDGVVTARLEVRGTSLDAVRVRPERLKRETRVDNGALEFEVKPGEKLVVQANSSPPLFLFALPIEAEKPLAKEPSTMYFGPGQHTPGEIRLQSGQTLYLAAGAHVKGRVYAFEAQNVRVCGRGVLDAQGYTDRNKKISGMLFERCRNVSIEGIQLRTGDWWQILMLLTDGVRIDHVHTLSFGLNNDGIDTDGVGNLRVRDSFIGCGDDGFGIHAVDAVANGEPATHDCLIERCVIWNEFAGNGLRIGASTETGEIRNIVFRSIDVLHSMNNAIMIDHSDWAHLRNIGFQDFHNDTPKPLANIAVSKTGYSNNTGFKDKRGKISRLVFKDVTSTGEGISLRGTNDQHGVQGVLLINCRVGDELLTSKSKEDLSVGKHVSEVQFTGHLALATEPATTDISVSPLELILDNGSSDCWAFAGKNLEVIDVQDGHGGTSWRIGQLGAGVAAVYEPRLQGRYEVAVHWGTHNGVATNAPWTVFHRQGYTTRTLDQNQSPGWHVLGEFDLSADSWVRLVNPLYPITDAPVIADAVRFRRSDSAATSGGN